MGILFVRERSSIGKGEGRPRFEIVAVSGADLKVYHSHVRKVEVEKIAAELEAEIIYLPRGEGEGEGEGEGRRGGGRRRRGGRNKEQD